MIDYRGKTYIGMLEEENEKLQARWDKLKTLVAGSNLKRLIKKMEELEND